MNGSTDPLKHPGHDNDKLQLTAATIKTAVKSAAGKGSGAGSSKVPFVLSDKYNETEVGKWFTNEQDQAVKAAADKDPRILNYSHSMVNSAMVPRDEQAAWNMDQHLGKLSALPDPPTPTPSPTASPTFESDAPLGHRGRRRRKMRACSSDWRMMSGACSISA